MQLSHLTPETRQNQNLPPCGDDLGALASERVYHSDTYRLTVYCTDNDRPVENMIFEDGDYSQTVALHYIYEWLVWYADFDRNTQRSYVFNAGAILNNGTPKRGDDYIIVPMQAERNAMLFCKRSQLAPGDVVMKATGVTQVTVNHPWLNPINEQGYYRFWLIGGEKYEAFQHEPESVANWRESCRRWHFDSAKYAEMNRL